MYSWLAFILILFVFIILFSYLRKAGRLNKQLEQIRHQWGKPDESPKDFRQISAYVKAGIPQAGANQALAHDLDLDKVFTYINRTTSKPGQQYLYRQLHQPQTSVSSFANFEHQLKQLTADTSVRESIQTQLLKLSSPDAYYLPELFAKPHESPFTALQSFYIKTSAVIVSALSILLVLTQSQVYFLALLAAIIANVCLHLISKHKVSHYTVSLPQLLNLYSVGKWLAKQEQVNSSAEIDSSLSRLSKLKNSLKFVSLQNTIAKDPSDLSYAVTELIKIIFLIEPLLFLISINRVNHYRADIEVIYRFIGVTDMLISVASLRKGLPYYCTPAYGAAHTSITIKDLYHPLIEDCVPNSISLNYGQGILITGSNMSGKTTFIRALALNALLAQTIHTCCANSYEAPLLNIHTSIHMSDDMEAHKSYFQAEALSVLHIIQQTTATWPVLSMVIIDEIFRGTNTIERIAAAKAVLAYLTRHQCFVLVSTHDLELAELLGDEYAVYSFEETVADRRLVFDYLIKPGLLKNKNGIAILQGLGYPESIVQDAHEVNELMRNKYKL